MVAPLATLPDSIECLQALVLVQQRAIADLDEKLARQEQTVSEYSEEISQLREYIRLLKSQRIAPRSERSVPEQRGLDLPGFFGPTIPRRRLVHGS